MYHNAENSFEEENDENISHNRRVYSRSILSQSIPSLLISFIGFTIAGMYLENAYKKEIFKIYPLLLVSTCILSFKGNIELIFAMHLSSVSNTENLMMEYAQFAINNSCMVIIQSILIGFSVGIVGTSTILLRFTNPMEYILKTICSCIFSCFISTLVVLMILFIAITIFKNLNINPDNVVLPTISAFSDYFTVISLIFFFKFYHHFDSIFICLISIFLVFLPMPFIAKISIRSQTVIPISSYLILFFTFLLSSIAGLIIEYFSTQYQFLAVSATVFSGLTSATSFIYLNRKLTSLYNRKPHNKRASLLSLLMISLAMSFTFIFVSNTLFIKLTNFFSFLFIISFLIDVYLLIELVDFILTHFQRSIDMAGAVALPIITSLADFLGSLFLVSILYLSNNI